MTDYSKHRENVIDILEQLLESDREQSDWLDAEDQLVDLLQQVRFEELDHFYFTHPSAKNAVWVQSRKDWIKREQSLQKPQGCDNA